MQLVRRIAAAVDIAADGSPRIEGALPRTPKSEKAGLALAHHGAKRVSELFGGLPFAEKFHDVDCLLCLGLFDSIDGSSLEILSFVVYAYPFVPVMRMREVAPVHVAETPIGTHETSTDAGPEAVPFLSLWRKRSSREFLPPRA